MFDNFGSNSAGVKRTVGHYFKRECVYVAVYAVQSGCKQVLACGNVVRTEVGVLPLPVQVLYSVAVFDITVFDIQQLDTVDVEVPVVLNLVVGNVCRLHDKLDGSVCADNQGRGNFRTCGETCGGSTLAGVFRVGLSRFYKALTRFKTVCVDHVLAVDDFFKVEVFKLHCQSFVALFGDFHLAVTAERHTYVECDVVDVQLVVAEYFKRQSVGTLGDGNAAKSFAGPVDGDGVVFAFFTCHYRCGVERGDGSDVQHTRFADRLVVEVSVEGFAHGQYGACARVSQTPNDDYVFVCFVRGECEAEVVACNAVVGNILAAADVFVVDNQLAALLCDIGNGKVDVFRFYLVDIFLIDVCKRCFGDFGHDALVYRDCVTSGLAFVTNGDTARARLCHFGSGNLTIGKRNVLGSTVTHCSGNFQSVGREFFAVDKHGFCTGCVDSDAFYRSLGGIVGGFGLTSRKSHDYHEQNGNKHGQCFVEFLHDVFSFFVEAYTSTIVTTPL